MYKWSESKTLDSRLTFPVNGDEIDERYNDILVLPSLMDVYTYSVGKIGLAGFNTCFLFFILME